MITLEEIIEAATSNGMRELTEERVRQIAREYAELMVRYDRKRMNENLKKYEKTGGWMNYDEIDREFLDTDIELI